MTDTMHLGAFGGGKAKTQRYVIGAIDPSSKWVHCEVFQGKSPTQGMSKDDALTRLKESLDPAHGNCWTALKPCLLATGPVACGQQ